MVNEGNDKIDFLRINNIVSLLAICRHRQQVVHIENKDPKLILERRHIYIMGAYPFTVTGEVTMGSIKGLR